LIGLQNVAISVGAPCGDRPYSTDSLHAVYASGFMQFEWDEAKNLDNIRKHRIDFADVPVMFDTAMLIELDDRFDYDEDRWSGIGFLGTGVAVVVWAERQENTIRIISARRANRYERQRLKQYLRD
jgi:uncharacterized protein